MASHGFEYLLTDFVENLIFALIATVDKFEYMIESRRVALLPKEN